MKKTSIFIGLLVIIAIIAIIGYIIYDLDNENNTFKEEKNEKTEVVEKNNKQKAINEFKKALLDEKWVADNLSLKVDAFGNKINDYSMQERKFEIINNEDEPIIVVQTEDIDNLSLDIFILRYVKGKVDVEQFREVASYHNSYYYMTVGDDKLGIAYAHMGECGCQVFNISNNEEKLIYELDYIESEDYSELDEIEERYDLKIIEKDLNQTNIEKYIK